LRRPFFRDMIVAKPSVTNPAEAKQKSNLNTPLNRAFRKAEPRKAIIKNAAKTVGIAAPPVKVLTYTSNSDTSVVALTLDKSGKLKLNSSRILLYFFVFPFYAPLSPVLIALMIARTITSAAIAVTIPKII